MDTSQHSRPPLDRPVCVSQFVPMLMALLTAFSSERLMVPPLLVLIMGPLIAAPVTLLVELPLALWLRKIGHLNAPYLCLAGALVGALALGLYSLQANYWPQMNDKALARWIAQQAALKAMLPGGIYGLLSAVAFSVGASLTIRQSRRRFRGAA